MAGGIALSGYKPDKTADLPPLKGMSWLLAALTFLAMQSGFLFGYDTGIVSGAMVIIKNTMNLNDLWQELVISVTLGAAAVAAFLGGYLNSAFGRKWVIFGSSLLFIVGALILAFSVDKEMLLIGRIILGLAIGVSSCTIPPYIAECAPTHVRGRMLVTFQLSMTCGFWIAAIIAASLSYIRDQNLSWRIMLGIGAIPAIVQAIGFYFMPESPRWLALNGREDEAYRTMVRIYGGNHAACEHAHYELKHILDSEEKTKREHEKMNLAGKSVLGTMFRTPYLRKALIIGCSLQMFQQLSGINTVNYYGATIVMMSGVQNRSLAIWLTAVTSGVKFFSTFLGIYLVEKIGRRLLLLCSTFGVFLMLILLGTSFTLIAKGSPRSTVVENATLKDGCSSLNCDLCSYEVQCGFCYDKEAPETTGACVHIGSNKQWALYGRCAEDLNTSTSNDIYFMDKSAFWNYGYCPTTLSWLPILSLVLYLFSFASGYAPMPWTINAEIYPNWARSAGNSMSTMVNYAFNLFISLTFLTLARAITRQWAFFLYAILTFVGLVWFYLVIPETKNKSMEDLQATLTGPWFSRGRELVKPATQKNGNSLEKH